MKEKKSGFCSKEIELIDKYRVQSVMSTGSERAKHWYKRGLTLGKRSSKYDDENYTFYYDCQKHDPYYEMMGRHYFERAARCFKRAAWMGHDLSMMNYALYLFAFKSQYSEAFKWFVRASESGLAVADYQLYVFYKYGYCSVKQNDELSEQYLKQYEERIASNERQRILALHVESERESYLKWFHKELVIGRSFMFNWFQGYSFHEVYDTPKAKPSKWKYGD